VGLIHPHLDRDVEKSESTKLETAIDYLSRYLSYGMTDVREDQVNFHEAGKGMAYCAQGGRVEAAQLHKSRKTGCHDP